MAYTRVDQPLGGNLHAVLDEIEADILQYTKKWNRKMDCLTSTVLQQKHSSYKCEFCTKVNASI